MLKRTVEEIIINALNEDQRPLKYFIKDALKLTEKSEIDDIAVYVFGIVSLIPIILERTSEMLLTSLDPTGVTAYFKMVEDYFFDSDDIIPEKYFPGILGLLDDAYYAIYLLENLSCSFPEIELVSDINLKHAKWFFEQLLGEKLVASIRNRFDCDLLRTSRKLNHQKLHNFRKITPDNIAENLNIYNSNNNNNNNSNEADEDYFDFYPSGFSDWNRYQSSSYNSRDRFNENYAR